jgi:CHASE2 domain-containing sensor protein
LGILVTLLVFPTSLFWFPAPENPSLRVEGYLAWERQFLTEGRVAARVALVLLIVGFFVALAAAFWKRSWLWGLAVLNAGTLLKVICSVVFGGAGGWASLAPSLFTLAVTDAAIVLAARWLKRRRAR